MSNQQKAMSPRPAQPGLQPEARSEALLPTDGPDENLEVAEEVSLDLQSDSARRVGAMPGGKPGEALAHTLEPGQRTDTEELKQAIERAVPPSV